MHSDVQNYLNFSPYGLFNDAVSSSDYTAANDRMRNELERT
jgi:hypothetical protein